MQECDVLIASGQTIMSNGPIDTWGWRVVGVLVPAGWTAADITFTSALTETGTAYPVTDAAGTALKLTVAASKWVAIDPILLVGTKYLRLVSSVAQAADRHLTVILRQET